MMSGDAVRYAARVQRTNNLLLRTASTRFQASAGRQEGTKSKKTLAVRRDAHIMNCEAFETISVQYLTT